MVAVVEVLDSDVSESRPLSSNAVRTGPPSTNLIHFWLAISRFAEVFDCARRLRRHLLPMRRKVRSFLAYFVSCKCVADPSVATLRTSDRTTKRGQSACLHPQAHGRQRPDRSPQWDLASLTEVLAEGGPPAVVIEHLRRTRNVALPVRVQIPVPRVPASTLRLRTGLVMSRHQLWSISSCTRRKGLQDLDLAGCSEGVDRQLSFPLLTNAKSSTSARGTFGGLSCENLSTTVHKG